MRLPIVDGVNVILIAQLVPAATALPQLFVWAKSTLFVPVMVMLLMASEPLPEFVKVTVCALLVMLRGWFPKLRLVGEKVIAGDVPVPVKPIVCGLSPALSVI